MHFNSSTEPEEDLYFYHPDHLGSSSFITERHNHNFDARYKFSAKELDDESGYTYFGARYYDSELSNWLSVDPMAKERPSLSPYNYVQWNPLNRVDPTGALDLNDEWELNKKGKVENRIANKKEDSFHIVDDKGNRIKGKSITFEYGTITDVNNPQVIVADNTKTLTMFNVKGDDNAKSLFEFFADPNNTNVEWTHAKIGTNKSSKNIVGSSHQKSSTAVGAYLRKTNYTLKAVNHNHPSGSYFPSKGDKGSAALYKNQNRNIKLNIYTHPNRYSKYDEKGTLDFRDFGPGIEVIGN